MLKKLGVISLCLFSLAHAAHADEYPSKPIRIVVGFAAGGGTDLLARILGEQLSQRLGQPVLVENKPGAAGAIAGSTVSRAKPDGYTLWLATQGSLTVAPLVQKPKPYDAQDFAPVSLLMTSALQLFVKDDFPARDFREFVELIKANPGKYPYATAGVAGPGHMMAELLSREVGLKMRHVPYPGDGQSVNDVLSGVVPIWSSSLAAVHAYVGKVRAIVTTGDKREALLPDTPTVQELGYPGATAYFYNALMAPKGTPSAVIEKLSNTVAEIYKDKATTDKIRAMGLSPEFATPEATGKYVEADINKWRDIVVTTQDAK